MKIDFEKTLSGVEQIVRKSLLEDKIQQLPPTFFLWGSGDNADICICQWRDEQEKVFMLEMIRMRARNINATHFCFAAESWLVVRDSKEKVGKLTPAEEPDRKECVYILVSDGFTSKMRHLMIKRSEAGEIVGFDVDQDLSGPVSGRFADILPIAHA